MSQSLESRFTGGMVGSALGDAIGELAFSHRDEPGLRARIARKRTLVYTDDTAMAIGLAQSLVAYGRIDERHLGDVFRRNYRREPWRGYASGPPTVFSMVERHEMSYGEAARSLFGGEGSYGNGAAMRIVPVGLVYHGSPDLYAQVQRSARVTHAHPVGVDGAAVLAWLIAQVVMLDPKAAFPLHDLGQGLVGFARTAQMRAKMAQVVASLAEAPPVAARRLGQSVAAHESVPYAIYAFLRHPSSFEACLLCAVLNGGDRDTLGAMACAISGAYLGLDAIPTAWRDKLENGQGIERLANDLWDRCGQEESTCR